MRSRLLALAEVTVTAGVLAATIVLLLATSSAFRGQTPPAAPPAPGHPASPPRPSLPPTPHRTLVTEP